MVLTTCSSHLAKYASPRSPKINNMADKIIGTFNLTESEGFDEFMKALGVGMVMRKMGNTIKPSVTFTLEAGTYTMKTASSLKTSEINFTLEGATLTQVQSCAKGASPTFLRTFSDTGLVCICECGGVKSTRTYVRA